MALQVKKRIECSAVVNLKSFQEALHLLGVPENVALRVTIRCDRGEIPLDEKAAMVVQWSEEAK